MSCDSIAMTSDTGSLLTQARKKNELTAGDFWARTNWHFMNISTKQSHLLSLLNFNRLKFITLHWYA